MVGFSTSSLLGFSGRILIDVIKGGELTIVLELAFSCFPQEKNPPKIKKTEISAILLRKSLEHLILFHEGIKVSLTFINVFWK